MTMTTTEEQVKLDKNTYPVSVPCSVAGYRETARRSKLIGGEDLDYCTELKNKPIVYFIRRDEWAKLEYEMRINAGLSSYVYRMNGNESGIYIDGPLKFMYETKEGSKVCITPKGGDEYKAKLDSDQFYDITAETCNGRALPRGGYEKLLKVSNDREGKFLEAYYGSKKEIERKRILYYFEIVPGLLVSVPRKRQTPPDTKYHVYIKDENFNFNSKEISQLPSCRFEKDIDGLLTAVGILSCTRYDLDPEVHRITEKPEEDSALSPDDPLLFTGKDIAMLVSYKTVVVGGKIIEKSKVFRFWINQRYGNPDYCNWLYVGEGHYTNNPNSYSKRYEGLTTLTQNPIINFGNELRNLIVNVSDSEFIEEIKDLINMTELIDLLNQEKPLKLDGLKHLWNKVNIPWIKDQLLQMVHLNEEDNVPIF